MKNRNSTSSIFYVRMRGMEKKQLDHQYFQVVYHKQGIWQDYWVESIKRINGFNSSFQLWNYEACGICNPLQ